MRLRDAVVLVTGATGGIGAACATALSEAGAQLVLLGRDPSRLAGVSADLGAKGVCVDLSTPSGAAVAAAAGREVFGRIDAVVHCAGVGWYGETADMPAVTLDSVLDINVRAPLQLTRELLGDMVARGSGHVCFVASIAGWTGVARESVYAATKSAIITFADSLRLELEGTGVGVSVVTPAAVRTGFFETRGRPYGRRLPRQLSPERVAAAIVGGIEAERAHQMVPHWLAVAPAVRTVAPSAFRALNRRFG